MSLADHDAQGGGPVERRMAVRRQEDYFWLKRLSDISGDACIVVNRDMSLAYTDPKLAELLRIEQTVCASLTTFSELTALMAVHGYFGPGEPHVFEALMADLLVNQRLKQSRTTQLINAFTPCGRHIDIRVSLGRDDSYIVLVRDNTGNELKKRALDAALKIGESGYWFYNLFSGEFRLRADSLKPHFRAETFEKILKTGFMQVIHPDDKAMTDAAINDTVNSRQPVGTTVRVIGDDKSVIYLSSHIMPNIDEHGKVRSLTCFFTNVSKQIDAQNELRELQGKTEIALKAKNDFLGRLSHEVRTPMNAVIGLADALVYQNQDPELASDLALIQSSADKIIRLVDETLDHTKLEDNAVELNIEDVSPAEIAKSACKTWAQRAANDGTQLLCKIHPDVPKTLILDGYRYEQCLNNLISNALKFSVGGSVQVVMTVAGEASNKKLVLAVRDTGIGMTKEVQEQIFLPFRQADKTISGRFGGTGLGLTITKDLVELMGGKISVTSEPGNGTMFVITLPLEQQTEEPIQIIGSDDVSLKDQSISSDIAAPSEIIPRVQKITSNQSTDSLVGALLGPEDEDTDYSRLRVLIVDDNATNHIVVSSLLSTIVGDIKTAHNGEEAITRLEQDEFDIVLMDIHMPVMDGIEATLAIRSGGKPYSQVPIIALTADPQYQQSRLCKNIGMNESLAKPIRLTSLLQAFDDVLADQDLDMSVAA